MAAKYFVILACLALSQASVVKRDAPTSTNLLEDIQKHAKEFEATFTDAVKQFTESKNTQEWQKAIKDGSASVAQQITSLTASLQNAIQDANGKAKETLEAARDSLQKTSDELRQAHPDLEAQAGALKDKLAAAVQNTLQETQKLSKELAANAEETNKKLAPALKQAYEDFVKQAEAVQKKLHDAANKQ